MRRTRRAFFALLCAALFLLPALIQSSGAEDPDPSVSVHTCDNCDMTGPAEVYRIEPEERNGTPGYIIGFRCQFCGEPFKQIPLSWEPAGEVPPSETEAPTSAPESTPDPTTAPDPTSAPDPVVPPEEPQTPPDAGGQNDPPEPDNNEELPFIPPDSNPQELPPQEQPQTPPQEDLPPAIPEQDGTGAERETPPPVIDPEPVPQNLMNDPPVTLPPKRTEPKSEEPAPPLPEYNEANTWQGPVTRNWIRFPVFSKAYPSRRLNLEGDPKARAEVPGEKIWPEPDSSSPLNKKLGN